MGINIPLKAFLGLRTVTEACGEMSIYAVGLRYKYSFSIPMLTDRHSPSGQSSSTPTPALNIMPDLTSVVTPLKALLAPYLTHFQNDLLSQVVSSHPRLTALTQYYISQPSKRLRPCLILLMSQATNGLGSEWLARSTTSSCDQVGIRSPSLCTSLTVSQRVLCELF